MDIFVIGIFSCFVLAQTVSGNVTEITSTSTQYEEPPTPTPRMKSSTGSYEVMPWSGLACKRFYLSGVNPKVIGHIQVAGVYQIMNMAWDDFPVWKLEEEEVYFYHDYGAIG